MLTSEEIDKITEALAIAQGEMEPLKLNAENPHFKNRFANLAETREKSRLPLSRNGLAIVQSSSFAEGRVSITTRLSHKSGQWMQSTLALKPMQDNPQAIGSAITYGKRYEMQAMLGLVGDDDDDGNAATQPSSPQSKPEIFNATNPNHVESLKKVIPEDKKFLFPALLKLMHGKSKSEKAVMAAINEAISEDAQLDNQNLF